MKIDQSLISLLKLDASQTSISSVSGGMSYASTSKITTTLSNGSAMHYFLKTGKGAEAEAMFEGEHQSLNAIHSVVPTLCPKSFGHGQLQETKGTSFLVTDFLDLTGRSFGKSSSSSSMTLAQKLAKLHTTPAPIPEGYDKPQFGFPVSTCCGSTPQDNSFSASWADFYANRRLRYIGQASRKANGVDKHLDQAIEETCTKVIPRLIGDDHLNHGKGITPVIIHGDLWSGNASKGRLPGMTEAEDIVYDSSACYAHSEFELGIMRMFGGFGSAFTEEYHALVPKTEPMEEYGDRVKLYELYHHLNHHALFGGGYRSGAMRIMESLIAKYGSASDKSEL